MTALPQLVTHGYFRSRDKQAPPTSTSSSFSKETDSVFVSNQPMTAEEIDGGMSCIGYNKPTAVKHLKATIEHEVNIGPDGNMYLTQRSVTS